MSLFSLRRKPRYADVVATLALVVAVGGTTAYAATALPKNSVGTAQLKNKSVVAGKIKNSAVTTGKIKNGAVTASNIKPGAIGPLALAPLAVGTGALQDGAVTAGKLGNGAVTSTAIGPLSVGVNALQGGSVDSSKIVDDTVTLGDLIGGDAVENENFGLGAGTCGQVSVAAPGALVGDLAVMSFFYSTLTPPANVAMGPAWVPSDGVVQASMCNLGSAITFSAQVRATTFR